MPWVAPTISAGASILGGLFGGDASDRAAQAQMAATQAAIAEQRRQYDQNRTDQAPWRDTGSLAINRLKILLGLGNNSTTDPAQLRAQFLPQFTKTSREITGYDNVPYLTSGEAQGGSSGLPIYGDVSTIDEAGLADAIRNASGGPDPAFGSLLRKFSTADLNADPVYQSGLKFGQEQGEKAINERAIANGGYDSGATLKALTRFGNDYGSTKAEGAYNRYTADNTGIYNKLAGVSGAGQNAANATTASGSASSNNIADLITQGGNAQAAGIVGGANAWGNAFGGIGTAVQGYQNNNILQKLLAGRGGGGTGSTSSFGGGINWDNV